MLVVQLHSLGHGQSGRVSSNRDVRPLNLAIDNLNLLHFFIKIKVSYQISIGDKEILVSEKKKIEHRKWAVIF